MGVKHASSMGGRQRAPRSSTTEVLSSVLWVSRFERLSRVVSIVVMVIAGVVLLGGYILGNPGLRNLAPGLPKMMPNTALGLLLSAVSLFLYNSTSQKREAGAGWIERFLAAAVAGLGIATIAEYLLGINLGIDELLFRDPSPGATYPGRPSPQTSLLFALAGVSLLLLGGKRLWVLWTGQLLGLIVGFIAIVAMVGYVYASVPFYGITTYTGMAVHTIFSFLMLSLGIVFAKPDRGLVIIFTSDSTGGIIMRRLLPPIIVIPVVLGILSGWGERKGLYSTNFGLALNDALYVAVLAVLLWFFARVLERAEASRRQMNEALKSYSVQLQVSNRELEQAQTELRGLNEQLEQRVKERTADLVETNERLDIVFESAADGIVIGDLSGVIERVNSKIAELVGYSTREELIGKTFFDFIIAREHEEVKVQMQKVLELGEAKGVCFTLTRKDGSLLQVEVSAGSLKNALGSPTGLVIVIRDITERMQAENERTRQSNYLELLKNAAIAINGSTSHEMALQYILDETCQKLGYAVGHFFNKTKGTQTLTSSGIWHLDDPERFKAFREVTESFHFAPNEGLPGRVFYSRKPEWIADVTQGQNFPRAKMGVDIGIKCGFAVPVFAGAEVEAVMEFFSPEAKAIDETILDVMEQVGTQLGRAFERKRAEEDRVKAAEQLMAQDRLASVGQLVAGITHEIRNPLTSVIGFSELLLQRDLPDDVKGDLKIVNDEAKRTVEIVNNLLTFARKQPEGKAEININEQIERVIALRAHDHKGNNIHVISHLASNLPAIMGNSSQILQVFFNLVVNAEQAMLGAHSKGTLTITTERAEDIVRVSITDDGPGISPENMNKLFVPFFTTKTSGKGNGLGLSICHGIVTGHGGRIWAESEPGIGATFIIELPTAPMAFDI